MITTATKPTSILPLVIFRVCFGALMFAGTLRFILKGWINEFYIAPEVHFTYLGFGWVKPLPGVGMYALFGALLVLASCIALGLFYRASMAAFFVIFTYVELIDKTYYLNHYYFISLLSFLLIFLPLNGAFSLDARRNPTLKRSHVPRWTTAAVQLQLGIVYFFAGVAKLKPDWLFDAMPLTIWLRANVDFPLVGQFFDEHWLHYGLSWAGAAYDLTIPFFLLWRRTCPFAYLAVIGFHVMTGLLFPIGMFPWIMIVCTLIFFPAEDFLRALSWFNIHLDDDTPHPRPYRLPRAAYALLGVFFFAQMIVPLRHWLYPGDVMWTEEGYRFAWNVMLAEKNGLTIFHVTDETSGESWMIFPSEYLTPQQEYQMSFQPDMILQFAHFLEDEFAARGHHDLTITVDAYVSVNGRASRRLIAPDTDLTRVDDSLLHKGWILQ